MLGQAEIRDTIRRTIAKTLSSRTSGRSSLLPWGKKYFPHYFTRPWGRHHHEMDKRIRRWSKKRGVRAAEVFPRGYAKSTFFNFLLPMWSICTQSEKYIIPVADTYSQSVKHVQGIQEELENNDALARDYPTVCGKGKQWSSEGILTKNGIRVEPLGTGQKIRGRRKGADRPTLLIIDDPEGDEAAYSKQIRSTTRDWATKGAFKAGAPGTNIIVSGTIVHRDCLVSHCSRLPGWETSFYVAMEQWPDRMDLWEQWELILRDNSVTVEEADANAQRFYEQHEKEMVESARVLWPELEDLYALMFMRASEGHAAFESEKQNNPIDPSKCEWMPDLFEGEDVWFDEWPDDCIVRVMALDPSKGKRDKVGDYQAIVMLAIDEKLNIYLDADMSRRPMQDMVARYVDLASEFEADVAVVEDEQFQELIVPECENEAVRQKILVPIEGIGTGKIPKPVRIRRWTSYITRKRVKFKRRSPGAVIMRQQFMDFPNGDYDDGPDGAEMALRRAIQLINESEEGEVDNPY